ncbi:hypothetical protein TBLA_0C05870 [Henningerozyma blattae CBS 6284]|uniref:YCII-related domain-containing protein n=1 Tax=Henningerozyma blattae (strain ATCC 34711 / CBS 6284 / DSM 70876 / NBRC 10599 / NRRL Y-10934 / UCD 77-7) TaxID=1071380 RepID=I2H1Y2_HENB6|nr:hypothetical protein TBLA_0C05870 [Tetrapisispora blattae CBS 6284]CCH60384.1 hypothetical protein TBLA_0C05870 [Tetrapisispora blattae CBS 6284]
MTEWYVTIKDIPNSDRTPVLKEHMDRLPILINAGVLSCGGALLDDNGNMIGSHFELKVETKEEAMKLINEDPFVKGGVWDMNSIQIRKFYCVHREEYKTL